MTLQKQPPWEVSVTPRDHAEDRRVDPELDYTEQYLKMSKRLRDIADLKISGYTATGRIDRSGRIQKSSKKTQRISKDVTTNRWKDNGKNEGIEDSETQRRKEAGDCQRCTWPSNRKGTHLVVDCIRPIKLDK